MGCLLRVFRHTAFICAIILTAGTAFASSRGCTVPWRSENTYLYLELSPFSRVRIQPSEFALRIHGMVETNESIFAQLQEHQGVRLAARRQSRSSRGIVTHTVFEGVAAKIGGKLLWILRYNGDQRGALDHAIVLSNMLSGSAPFSCQTDRLTSEGALSLDSKSLPGVTFLPDRVVEIQDDTFFTQQLGF